MKKESFRGPAQMGERELFWDQHACISIPDPDGQDAGEATVLVDRTVLDNNGI